MVTLLWPIKEWFLVEYDPSFDTQDLPQPQITPSKQTKGGAPLGTVPKNRRPLSQPHLVGEQYGSVKIISPQVVWLGLKERRFMHVLCECVGCGYRSIIAYSNLTGGRTKGCRSCNQPRRFPKWLYARTQAMEQRCTNPQASGYERYGGRGIKFLFDSPTTCALWLKENIGIPENAKDLELDRINNDGHYEPGNIRWVSKQGNSMNRRSTKNWVAVMHKFKLEHPQVHYADASILRLLSSGLSFEEIAKRWDLPSQKPKGKYGTFSIADPEIASLVKDF